MASASLPPLNGIRALLLCAVVLVAGCRPANAANQVLRVFNQGDSSASLYWHGQGVLGTGLLAESGVLAVSRCSEADRTFGPGTWELTISNATTTASFTIEVSDGGQVYDGIAVRSNGTVDHLYHVSPEQPEPSPPPLC